MGSGWLATTGQPLYIERKSVGSAVFASSVPSMNKCKFPELQEPWKDQGCVHHQHRFEGKASVEIS